MTGPRYSDPGECPGPETDATVTVDWIANEHTVTGPGVLIPADAANDWSPVSIRTGVVDGGTEIAVMLPWHVLRQWVRDVDEARARAVYAAAGADRALAEVEAHVDALESELRRQKWRRTWLRREAAKQERRVHHG